MSTVNTFTALSNMGTIEDFHNASITKLPQRPRVYAEYVKMQEKAGMGFMPLRMSGAAFPNAAYYTGLREEGLFVTSGIVDLLDDRELVAVLAHELKHREDYWLDLAAKIGITGMAAASLAYATRRLDPEEDKGKAITRRVFFGGTACVVLTGVQMLKDPGFELLADKGPKAVSVDYAALASALRKLEAWSKDNGYQASGFNFMRADRVQRWADEKNKNRSR